MRSIILSKAAVGNKPLTLAMFNALLYRLPERELKEGERFIERGW